MIEMYIKPTCPYCIDARALLTQKGVDIHEYDITKQPHLRDEMIKRANGRTTVPQIFIDGVHIGGCDDLFVLEHSGELDNKLTTQK